MTEFDATFVVSVGASASDFAALARAGLERLASPHRFADRRSAAGDEVAEALRDEPNQGYATE